MSKKTEPVKEATAPVFTLEQLAASRKYATRRDLLHALLEPDKSYTMSEVDERINKFLKGEVT